MPLMHRHCPQPFLTAYQSVRTKRVFLLLIVFSCGISGLLYIIITTWNPGAKFNNIPYVSAKETGASNLERTHVAVSHSNRTAFTKPWNCSNCFRWEYRTLLNQKDVCHVQDSNQTVDLVFLIPSTHAGRAQRDAIRNTWSSVTRNNTAGFRRVFFFGVSKDAQRMREVEEESRHFRDVVMFDFEDTYRNLTLKTLMMLRWLTEHCSNARYFLKVDDDMWVNHKALLTRLTTAGHRLHNAIGGHCNMKSVVIRDPANKWGSSYAEYPADHYPEYCSGTAYVSTVGVASQIVSVSRNVPFFFMEDVFLGLCLRQLRYPVVTLGGFHMDVPLSVRGGAKALCHVWDGGLVTVHRLSSAVLYRYWNSSACGS